tara:strand:+ start:732 stop:872 length:141 start_codon:yes stop_codon:yes gene_type:complete
VSVTFFPKKRNRQKNQTFAPTEQPASSLQTGVGVRGHKEGQKAAAA